MSRDQAAAWRCPFPQESLRIMGGRQRTIGLQRRQLALAHYLPRFICCAQTLCSLSREDAPEKRGLIEGEMTRNALQFIRSGHRLRIEQFAPRATLLDWLRLGAPRN